MTNVFIGSTSKDLEKYRDAAIAVCNELGFVPIAMEFFEAMGVGATEGSKRKVDEADLYTGIFGFRYGYIERPAYDRGVTEIEFDYAGERGLERLCFLADPNHPWPPAVIDTENHQELKAFKERIDKHLIRAQFTTVDDFKAKFLLALVKWRDQNLAPAPPISTFATTAVFAQTSDAVPERPRRLIGRDDLLAQVHTALDRGEHVLLQGFGGMGKTALAATVAAQRTMPILWLKAGNAEANALFEALARPFDALQKIARATGEAKITMMRDLLAEKGLKLLVLDDAWNGEVLNTLLKAVPRSLPVLVTSRHRYPLDTVLPVEELTPDAALEVLGYYAQQDYSVGAQGLAPLHTAAQELCEKLGFHAYALEIAGKTLRVDEITPAELLKRIEDAPHDMAMPGDFADKERQSVKQLLDASVNALKEIDETAYYVFLAFGALFAPSATPELLGLYLERDEKGIAGALNLLQRRGLAERVADNSIAYYRVHDLAYSYARAQINDDGRHRALDACLAYTERYNEPSLENFAALAPELSNFMGAANWAFSIGQYYDMEQFISNLYTGSEFLSYQGFFTEAITLLNQALNAAEKRGNYFRQAMHLGNLGYTNIALGQYTLAINYLNRSLRFAEEIRNLEWQCICLSNLGNAYFRLGQFAQVVAHESRAITIAKQINNRHLEGIALGHIGNVHFAQEHYSQALEKYAQALDIARQLGDKRNEGYWLGDIGNVHRNSGQYEQAIEIYEQALTIARELGDKPAESNALSNLGLVHMDLGELEKANTYLNEGLSLTRKMGDLHGEANDFNNIGAVYDTLGDNELALSYYQQARAIFEAIGAMHVVEKIDGNIADVRAKLSGAPGPGEGDSDG